MSEGVVSWDDEPEIGILANHLDRAFPFHFAVNSSLELIQAGRTIMRLLPDIQSGTSLSSCFRFTSPKIQMGFSAICEQRDTVFFLESSHNSSLVLRGQFLQQSYPRNGLVLLFIGSPVVRDTESILGLGLGLNDFATHDAVLDLLLLLQSKTNTIVDSQRMAEQLKAEVIVRRQAEKELERLNYDLEGAVSNATSELAETNRNLRETVSRLRQRNEFMNILNQMSDRLQSCNSVRDSYQIISHTMQMLYPGSYGVAAFEEKGNSTFSPRAKWGKRPKCSGIFKAEDCPAVQVAKDRWPASVQRSQNCPAVDCEHACMPLVSQEKLIGILHVGWEEEVDPAILGDEGIAFLKSAGEHIALAISNLNLQETLLRQSTRDPLTGLFNRRYMDETLSRELQRAKRTHASIGVIMLDVDNFKRINDEYGHDVGDEVLAKLANFLQAQVRGEDVACRFGGEEFFLILPGANVKDTYNRATQICKNVGKKIEVTRDDKPIGPVTLSLGVACYPEMGTGQVELVKLADDALYMAKRGGRNRVELAVHH